VLELRRIEVEMTKAARWDGKLPEHIYASAPIPYFNTAREVAPPSPAAAKTAAR
jgi:prohibitin 2